MNIDLSLLHNSSIDQIDISGKYDIPSSYYKDTDIKELSDIAVRGKIILKENEDGEPEDYSECVIEGIMKIPDTISLEIRDYKFSIYFDDFIEETCIKFENTLDIFQFLWENIVLEVPLRFTKVSDLSKFHGDGWKLVSEEELNNSNNPFSDLLNDFEEE